MTNSTSNSPALYRAPSFAAPAQSTPVQLRLRRRIIVVLTLLLLLAGGLTYRFYAHVAQTIGRDAVPSIVAAEKIRTTLADAHTQLLNVFLAQEAADGPSMQAYDKSIATAHDFLLDAGQNITYGDDERKPILTAMQELSEYERLAGRALADKGAGDALQKADALMRERILPAAAELDRANFVHLDAAFGDERHQATWWLAAFCAIALALVGALFEAQRLLTRTFRRIVNPALFGATAVVAGAALVFLFLAGGLMANIRSAKEDAFDSVHALARAEALAYAANASESAYLLSHGGPTQAEQERLFQNASAAMFEGASISPDLKQMHGHGLLGDELANITFPGEEAAARRTAMGWQTYLAIDARIRLLERAGKHAEAVALCMGTHEGESDWAFEQFNAALADTLKINDDAFHAIMDRAYRQVDWLGLLLLPLLFAPLLGSFLGFKPRLAEYRA
jgi:hypothetical protein